MAYVRVAQWTPEQVADWLYGLDDVIRPYACAFVNNDIGGRHLVTLASDDLHSLNIWKLGHQELLLEAAEHLSQSFFHLETENLQWLALRLSCKARSLYSVLPREEDGDDGASDGSGGGGSADGRQPPNDEELRLRRRRLDHVTTSTLSAVSDVIASVKAMVQWLDRPPFDANGHGQQSSVESAYVRMRTTLLQLGVELAMNAQRDKFAERPNAVIRNVCLVMATMCDKLIQESRDSLILQPASLEVATVRKKPNEELGMHIQCLFSGSHIIGRVKYQSPASSGGRVERGDEIVQVNYQTVVGWTLKKLVDAMKENPTEVILTLKKRPRHTSPFGRIYTQHFLFAVKPLYVERRSSSASKKKFGKPSIKPESGDPEPVRTFSPSSLIPPPSLLQPSGTVCSSLMETVTTEDEEDDDSAFLSEVDDSRSSAVDVQLAVPKLQVALQRRATVTGASPTSSRPPVSIDQLWQETKRDIINRSYSYDVSGSTTVHGPLQNLIIDKHRRGVIGRPLPPPPPSPSIISSNADNDKLSASSSAIRRTIGGGETVSHYETLVVAKDSAVNEKVETAGDESPELSGSNHYEDVDQRPCDSKTICPAQMLIADDDDDSCKSYQVVVVGGVAQKCASIPKEPKRSPLPSPLLRHRMKRWEFANRRISCKDLGRGDCQGWLHRGRARNGVKGTSPVLISVVHKWTKRWCVLKTDGLYVYEDVQAQKAECFVCLVGFSISPAPECKSKKYAFKAYHSGTEFYFASDSQRDMSKWMNKMGLAAISFDMQNCVTTSGFVTPFKQSVATESVFYSESEEDVEDTRKSFSNESRLDSADGSSSSPSSSSSYHSTLESPPPPKVIANGAGTAERVGEYPATVGEPNVLSADGIRVPPPVFIKSRECMTVCALPSNVVTREANVINDANNLPNSSSNGLPDTGPVKMSLAFEMNLDFPPRRNLATEDSVSLWSSSTLPSTSNRGLDSSTVSTNTPGPRSQETATKSLTMSALKLFGSPKFVKKFAASHRQPAIRSSSDRNPSSVWFNTIEKNSKSGSQDSMQPPPPPPPPVSFPEKRFLRSPRLTRVFFSSKATSVDDHRQQRVPLLTGTNDKCGELIAKCGESTEFFRISSIPSLLESDASEDLSQQTEISDVGHFTFALPTTDAADCFPRLPLKPTMGVSMIGKQRRTSAQSTDSVQSSTSSTSTMSTGNNHHQHNQQQQPTVPLFVSMASQGTQTDNG